MGGTPISSKRDQAITRQTGSDNKDRHTKERERAEILPVSNPIPTEVYRKCLSANRYSQKNALKTKRMEPETRTHGGVQQPEKTDDTTPMPSTLQLTQREHPNYRRECEATWSDTMAETEKRKFKTDWIFI